jgi:hypothetical protein
VLLDAEMGAFRARFVLPPLLVPVPLRVTVRVGLVALLDTVTFPEAAPAAVGVNVTLTVQDAPAAIEAPQVLVDANGPVAETEDTLAAAPPVLVTVTVWAAEVEPTAWLPKDRELGDAASVALPPELVPVPDRLTELVTPPALTVRVPVRLPVAVGVNFTLTVHEPFAAIEDPHVLVCAKSPLAEIDETDAAELVGLETVTVCALLVEPVVTEPKFSALGATVTPELG